MSVTIFKILEKLVARYLHKINGNVARLCHIILALSDAWLLKELLMEMTRKMMLTVGLIISSPVKVKVLWVMGVGVWGAVRFTEAPRLPRQDLSTVGNRHSNLRTIVGISLNHLGVCHDAHPLFHLQNIYSSTGRLRPECIIHTWPKTTCFPSRWGQFTVVMKNWDPLVFGPEFAMDSWKNYQRIIKKQSFNPQTKPPVSCFSRKFSSANFSP